jgi:hypothetical protein
MSDVTNARGYRNKNPGNIDFNPANKWQGQVGREATGNPPRFAVFESHEFGIRALVALLTTYQDRHGLNTITGMISRWCPPKDDHAGNQRTDLYIKFVSDKTGFDANEVIDIHQYIYAEPLVKAIIQKEIGGQPYSQAVIDEGLRRAGVVKPVASFKEAAQTGSGKSAIQVGAIAAAAATAAPALTALSAVPAAVGVVLVLCVTALAIFFVLRNRQD